MTTKPQIQSITKISSNGLLFTITEPTSPIVGFQVEVDINSVGYLPLSTRNKIESGYDYLLFVGSKDTEELEGQRNINQVLLANYNIGTTIQLRVRNLDSDDALSDWTESSLLTIGEDVITQQEAFVHSPHNHNFYDNEFNLFDSLQNEVIQKRGIDVVYLPQQAQKTDLILGEDVLTKFSYNYRMKMFLVNFTEFGGEGSIFGHFGLQVNDQATFDININEFNRETSGYHPVEGDLIYVEMGKWVMEIFDVKKHDPFFFMGKPSKYIIQTRKFEYSHEEMDTGIDELDELEELDSTDVESENDEIDDDINDILNTSEPNIFGDR